MQIEALAGITTHGCNNANGWLLTLAVWAGFALIFATVKAAQKIRERRFRRRAAALAARIGQAWADNHDRF